MYLNMSAETKALSLNRVLFFEKYAGVHISMMLSEKPVTARVRLPNGREITPIEALRFCYNLSETDIEVLLHILRGDKYDVDTLAKQLNLSKATINRSLNKLTSLGFVEKEREARKSAGRPKYYYYVRDPHSLIQRIKSDLELCAKVFQEGIQALLEQILSTTSKGMEQQ